MRYFNCLLIATDTGAKTRQAFLMDILTCCLEFLEYIGIGVAILLIIHFLMKPPQYVFRKFLHLVAFTSVIEMILVAESWTAACITAILFAVVVYPVLLLLEGKPWFSRLLVEKKAGEIKKSLLLLFFTAAGVIAFAWGLFREQYIAVAAVLMWGVGDAAAALVGIRFGKHVIRFHFADGKKTWEGTGAMFAASFLCGIFSLGLLSCLGWGKALAVALPCAVLAAFTELISHGGNDTVTVPTVVTLALTVGVLLVG